MAEWGYRDIIPRMLHNVNMRHVVASPRFFWYSGVTMKAKIHPKGYRSVLFEDASSGESILLGSTIATKLNGTWSDGKEYPKVIVEISSASHPFYTGKESVIDTAGRVEKFKRRAALASVKK